MTTTTVEWWWCWLVHSFIRSVRFGLVDWTNWLESCLFPAFNGHCAPVRERANEWSLRVELLPWEVGWNAMRRANQTRQTHTFPECTLHCIAFFYTVMHCIASNIVLVQQEWSTKWTNTTRNVVHTPQMSPDTYPYSCSEWDMSIGTCVGTTRTIGHSYGLSLGLTIIKTCQSHSLLFFCTNWRPRLKVPTANYCPLILIACKSPSDVYISRLTSCQMTVGLGP